MAGLSELMFFFEEAVIRCTKRDSSIQYLHVSTQQTKLKKLIGMYAYPMLLIPQIHCCRNKSMIEFTLLVSSC